MFQNTKTLAKLFTLAAFVLLFSQTVLCQTVRSITQNILNDKTIRDPYERWKTANDTFTNHIPNLTLDEALYLNNDLLLSFVDKNVKDNLKRAKAKFAIFSKNPLIYETLGFPVNDEKHEAIWKKALEYADNCRNDTMQADIYFWYGNFQSTSGNIPLAQEYYYKAIALYENLTDFEYIFRCLFFVAENLLVTKDMAGLRKVMEQMQQYTEMPAFDGHPMSLYYFYSVQNVYYGLLSENYPEIAAYADTTLQIARKTIHVTKILQERGTTSALGFAYYNMALTYKLCYPQQYDSIYYYLQMALDLKLGFKTVDAELEICVYIIYAKLHFAQKRYKEAEQNMLYVLSLLEEVNDDNTTPEYADACNFLVMYYKTFHRYEEALKYHELLLEVERKRFGNEKIVAMNDMLVKYETEKKQARIELLTLQNVTAKKILFLTVCIVGVLLLVLLTFIRIFRLRKKNYEISIYESALLAELKQNELEQRNKETEQLETQYQQLKAQSEENIQKSQETEAKLKQIECRLEQKPTKTIIEKLNDLITKSYIEKTKKNHYIQQLSELDIDMLELGYNTATEKISNMDMKYIACFAIDMGVPEMGAIFNVEPTTIHTVRYRIKKKFGNKNTFKFLI